jgi:outer membrane protein TolC
MKIKQLILLVALAFFHAKANSENKNPISDVRKGASLSEILRIVVADNPSIKAARAKWEMMKARVPQTRAWEDLRLSANSVAGRFVDVPSESFMNQSVIIEQELPVSGKNLSRARASIAEAAETFEELRRAELDAVTRSKISYFKLSGAYAQLKINDKNRELLNQMVQISRAKYEVGTQSQADVLLAQTDLARLAETRALIQRDISDQQSLLNVLMNLPARTPVASPEPLTFKCEEVDPDRFEALALANRPEIVMAQRKIEAEKARLQLAKKQWVSDPALSVTTQRYNDTSHAVNEVDVGISLPLPWLNRAKYSAGITEAEKSLENAQLEYEAARTGVLGMVRDQLEKILTTRLNYRLYRDEIVPLANESVQTTRASYESDKTSFLELITARRTLQDVDSTALDHLTNYKVALAELEAIVGNSNPILPATTKTNSK